MLQINKVFKIIHRTFLIVMLVGLVWLQSLPTTSVLAATTSSANKAYSSNEQTPEAFDELESGKRAAEVIPKELGAGSRQKNPAEMLKRAGEELGNDQVQRAFGAKDYDRSGLEKELARNKAQRGD